MVTVASRGRTAHIDLSRELLSLDEIVRTLNNMIGGKNSQILHDTHGVVVHQAADLHVYMLHLHSPSLQPQDASHLQSGLSQV